MRKIKLSLDTLSVQSFTTAAPAGRAGTVVAHDPTKGHTPECGSAFDACQTGLCTFDCPDTYAPAACPTAYPEYC